MTSPDTHTSPEQASTEQSGIKDQSWLVFDDGSPVVSADGEEIGAVRERMPLYLVIRHRKNLLSDVELYVPRDMVDRVEDGRVMLNRTATQLEEMDLTTPPALQE